MSIINPIVIELSEADASALLAVKARNEAETAQAAAEVAQAIAEQQEVGVHEAKTTGIHGITSPDTIESTAGAQAKVDAAGTHEPAVGSLVRRDASGRTQVEAGVADKDVVNVGQLPYVSVLDFGTDIQAIQDCLDFAYSSGVKNVIFPPGNYVFEAPGGVQIFSGMTLWMYGANIFLSSDPEKINADGRAFFTSVANDVCIMGGTIQGNRSAWPDSTNIVGVEIIGGSRITICDMYIFNLSSNGIRVHGVQPSTFASNVILKNNRIVNCSAKYVDYLEDPPGGPAAGTDREDGGNISLWNVNNFLIDGNLLTSSAGDGVHFLKCTDGRIVNNNIRDAKMGGLLLENCIDITVANNRFYRSGSRGITIEHLVTGGITPYSDGRTHRIKLQNNYVGYSGREGIWLRNARKFLVSGNLLFWNGQKQDTPDANLYISNEPIGSSEVQDILVTDNKSYTVSTQSLAFRATSSGENIVFKNNFMGGSVNKIRMDCYLSGDGTATVECNNGWNTETRGIATFSGDATNNTFVIPHGLDFSDPADGRMLDVLKIFSNIKPMTEDAAGNFYVEVDVGNLTVNYISPPPAGTNNIVLAWEAITRVVLG
jgi:parallel beta-helix repeat protein